MRSKDKIEKYLEKLVKQHNGEYAESSKSRYYSIRGRILRVSDHVGINSGNISILLDNSDQGHYIIHGHTSGNISVLNYEQTKEFVRSFITCSFIYSDVSKEKPFPDLPKPVSDKDLKTKQLTEFLTFLYNHFTTNQRKQIGLFVKARNPVLYQQIIK